MIICISRPALAVTFWLFVVPVFSLASLWVTLPSSICTVEKCHGCANTGVEISLSKNGPINPCGARCASLHDHAACWTSQMVAHGKFAAIERMKHRAAVSRANLVQEMQMLQHHFHPGAGARAAQVLAYHPVEHPWHLRVQTHLYQKPD